ncbi:MAG: S8 family serine peptidase [Planctomycetota bacterium]
MRKCITWAIVTIFCTGLGLAGSDYGWTQLSLSTCRVDEFIGAHPLSNGHGVVIAVLDTGVDPAIPGLTHTPDGAVKVVDVQDFTGEGDIELHWIRLDADGQLVEYDDDGVPIKYEAPPVPATPAGAQRRWWFGVFDESKFINSDQSDLNDNGATDDKFPILVTALSDDGDDQAVCYVDTDMDRGFADEQPLRNYRLEYDTFTLAREAPEKQIVPLTFAVNIFLRQSKVVIHFDDGAHGTHVAGIAAGYRINNQDNFHGVAPGAQIISLKIGQNAIGGVSTTESMKRAFEYAARYAREHGVQVVCNMSYGVESEIEGHSDIDKFVDELLRENPYLVFCTSAGNSGPGLSTVGTPSAATECICVAALMAADTGRDVAGFTLDQAVMTVFSSRGGELDKPDLAVPGWSTSTVPRWVRRGDFWSGTSMASPYAAGLCALLISHQLHQDSATQVRACDLRRALGLSASPVPGATALDMGYGVPNMPKAAEVLNSLVVAAQDDPIISYDISTPSPHGYRGCGRTAYWRSTFFPADERQVFTITPVFAPAVDAAERTAFTRKFELRSQTPWCRVPQETFYLRGEQNARVYIEYDARQLTEPGLHVGVVEALVDGRVAFRLINTVIVPYTFNVDGNYTRVFKDQTAQGWNPQRFFVAVPPAASAMKLLLTAPSGQSSHASFDRIYDPRGAQFRRRGHGLDTDNGRREIEWTFTDELTPGVWEVDVHANRPDKQWPYDLTVQFFGLHAAPERITAGGESSPSGEVTVTNMWEQPLSVTADGQIEGYRQEKDDNFEGLSDVLEYSVKLDERFNRLRLYLEMAPEDYARTTDIGVRVENSDGEAIYSSAFDGRVHTGTVNTPDAGSLTVIINGGFAVADDKRETPITVQLDQLFAEPVPVSVKYNGGTDLRFVPAVPMKLSYSTSAKLKDPPKGLRPVGYLRFRERTSEDTVLRVPLDIGG